MTPTAAQVKAAREAAGLTQAAAAALVGLKARQRWLEYEGGVRKMPAHRFELFKLKTKGGV